MVGIYKITNPKGKIYIGQSTDIENRKKNYRLLDCKKQTKIYNSLKKYGWKKHKFEILEECNIEILNERERYYQDKFKVLNSGLNLKLTSSKGKSGYLSEETKFKIGNSNKGKKRTPTQIQKIKDNRPLSEEGRQKIIDAHLGTYHTEETKKKISQSNIGKNKGRKVTWGNKISKALKNKPQSNLHKINRANSKKRKVEQFDMEGNLIKTHNSVMEAANFIGHKRGTVISNCCKGRIPSVKGYKFKYKN